MCDRVKKLKKHYYYSICGTGRSQGRSPGLYAALRLWVRIPVSGADELLRRLASCGRPCTRGTAPSAPSDDEGHKPPLVERGDHLVRAEWLSEPEVDASL